ncbi:MAG: murein biosynthesis integral membrane protein MurJ [Vicinamibacteria bacterium]
MPSSPAEKKVRARPGHPSPSSAEVGTRSSSATVQGTEQLTRSAGKVSVAVMASRVLGLVREMVLAYFFPTGGGLDAFYAAFRIPNLLRDMFAEGALSKAFVSTFTDVGEKEGEQAGVRLSNLVVNAVLVVVGLATLLGIYFSEEIANLMLPGEGFDLSLPADEAFGFATKRALTVFLTQVMFPFLLLVSLAAVAMGFLNARGRFFVPALSSMFFNLGSIGVGVAGYFAAPRLGQHPTVGMAVGVLAGGALQLLWQVPALRKEGYRYQHVLSFRDPGFINVIRMFGPGALVAATVQVNVFINSIFASLGSGWMSWISQSFRLLHLPIGLVGVAVSVATLPALSRAVARSDLAGFRDTFSYAMRLVLFFSVPASVGLIVLAEPVVRLIYERGRFQPEDTLQVAAALVFYAIGLTSYAAVKIVTDGFYALQDIRAPLLVSILSMISNAALNWFFVVVLGMDHRGLALSTSCTMTVSLGLLWVLLRRKSRLAGLGGRAALLMLVKMAVASLVMGAAAFAASQGLDRWLGHETTQAQLTQVVAAIGLALVVLFLACKALRVREMDQALRALIGPRKEAEVS